VGRRRTIAMIVVCSMTVTLLAAGLRYHVVGVAQHDLADALTVMLEDYRATLGRLTPDVAEGVPLVSEQAEQFAHTLAASSSMRRHMLTVQTRNAEVAAVGSTFGVAAFLVAVAGCVATAVASRSVGLCAAVACWNWLAGGLTVAAVTLRGQQILFTLGEPTLLNTTMHWPEPASSTVVLARSLIPALITLGVVPWVVAWMTARLISRHRSELALLAGAGTDASLEEERARERASDPWRVDIPPVPSSVRCTCGAVNKPDNAACYACGVELHSARPDLDGTAPQVT